MTLLKTFSMALFAATLLSCGQKMYPLNEQEKQTVSELSGNLKTYCIGRFLLDVPASAYVQGDAMVDDVTFEALLMTETMFMQRMGEIESEYEGTKHIDGYQFLREVSRPQGHHTRLFIRLENKYEGVIGRILEGYKWSNGYLLKLKTKARDTSDEKYKSDPVFSQIRSDVLDKRLLILSMLERANGRANDQIPTDPGLCINGGFLAGKASDIESSSSFFVLRGKEDVHFTLSTDTRIQEKTTMLEDGRSIEANIEKIAGGRTLRKGKVALQGTAAEEWLIGGEASLHIPGHVFSLKANQTNGSANTPFIALDMENGGRGDYTEGKTFAKASLTEAEAVALWDVVSRTLRPRRGAF